MPDKSIKLYKKAKKLILAEFHFFKKTRKYFTKIMVTYFIKTNGVYVWDLNKRKYEDFFSVGQNILDIIINMSIE